MNILIYFCKICYQTIDSCRGFGYKTGVNRSFTSFSHLYLFHSAFHLYLTMCCVEYSGPGRWGVDVWVWGGMEGRAG